jgi:Tfp pilus assembly ATPase PilU
MYSMDDLLALADAEKADGLKLLVGEPPVIVRDGKRRQIEGPVITGEDTELFLLSLANSRQRRDFRERGCATFFFQFRGSILFLVSAWIRDGMIEFDIQ